MLQGWRGYPPLVTVGEGEQLDANSSSAQRPPQGCLEPRLSLVVNLSPGLHRPERTPPRLTPPSVCDVAASPRGQGCLADVPMSCPYQDHARGRSVLSPVPRAGTRAAQPSVVTLVLSSPGSQAQAPRLSPGCLAAPPDHPQPRASTLPSFPLTPASGSTLGGTAGLRRVRSSICLPCHASWGLCPQPGTPAPTEPSPTPAEKLEHFLRSWKLFRSPSAETGILLGPQLYGLRN